MEATCINHVRWNCLQGHELGRNPTLTECAALHLSVGVASSVRLFVTSFTDLHVTWKDPFNEVKNSASELM